MISKRIVTFGAALFSMVLINSYRHGKKVTKDGVTTYTWDK